MDLYNASLKGSVEEIEKIHMYHYVNTGLNGACESGNLELAKIFINKYGAWNTKEALYYACIRIKTPNKELINYLLEINIKYNYGFYLEVIKFLLIEKYDTSKIAMYTKIEKDDDEYIIKLKNEIESLKMKL